MMWKSVKLRMGQLFVYSMHDSMSIKKLGSLWSIVSTLSVLPMCGVTRIGQTFELESEVSQSLL